MQCYACPTKANRNIRGVEMCETCYVVALEHCADFTCNLVNEGPLPEAARRRLKEVADKLRASFVPTHKVTDTNR